MDPRDASNDAPVPSPDPRTSTTRRLELEIIVDDEPQDYALIGDLEELDEIFGELDRAPALLPTGKGAAAAEGHAEAPADPARELARRDTQITELQGMLEALKPLGEELAELQSARTLAEEQALAHESELAQLREELRVLRLTVETTPPNDPREAELASLRCENEELRGRVERLKERQRSLRRRARERAGVLSRERQRHAATRARLKEARRLASERWRALRDRKR